MLVHPILIGLLRVVLLVSPAETQDPPAQSSGPVPAEPSQATPAPRPAVVEADVGRPRDTAVSYVGGAGTPVGVAGVEVVHHLGSLFEISSGVGIGYSAAASEPHPGLGHVLQWAVMPRLRLGSETGSLTLGAGISGGNYGATSFCTEDPCNTSTSNYPTGYVLWSNFEIGGEQWWPNGFALRYFVGYGHGWCVNGTCRSAIGESTVNTPYFGFGLGYAFSTH